MVKTKASTWNAVEREVTYFLQVHVHKYPEGNTENHNEKSLLPQKESSMENTNGLEALGSIRMQKQKNGQKKAFIVPRTSQSMTEWLLW